MLFYLPSTSRFFLQTFFPLRAQRPWLQYRSSVFFFFYWTRKDSDDCEAAIKSSVESEGKQKEKGGRGKRKSKSHSKPQPDPRTSGQGSFREEGERANGRKASNPTHTHKHICVRVYLLPGLGPTSRIMTATVTGMDPPNHHPLPTGRAISNIQIQCVNSHD